MNESGFFLLVVPMIAFQMGMNNGTPTGKVDAIGMNCVATPEQKPHHQSKGFR